jgi:hypothetical protein
VSAAALLAITALEFLRAPRLPGVNPLPAGIERFEIGMLFCLMLLLSPVSSKPHFCMLLIPAWAVAREALLRRDRFLLAVTFLSAFAGLAANKDLVGKTIYDAVKWSGVITLETLMLFTACLWAHWRRTQDARLSDSNA